MNRCFKTSALIFLIALRGSAEKIPFPKTLVDATAFLRAGNYKNAEPLFRLTLNNALAKNDEYHAARARVGLSVCYVAAHDFLSSVDNAESALRYGIRAKDADIVVRAALNLSSVYRVMGNFASASQTLQSVNPFLSQVTEPALRSGIYLHLATDAARKRDWARAEPLYFASIDTAFTKGDIQSAALGWNLLGYMRLLSGELAKSEAALTEAFRLRRSAGNRNLGTSYLYLGMLRLKQGDARSALNLLDRAIAAGWNGENPERLSSMYYHRGKAKAALADLPGALEDFEEAITRSSQWREEILPADEDRVSFEVALDRRYDDYVSTGMAIWLKTRDHALSRRMFEVAEQHKSASFRQNRSAGQRLPAEYYQALAKYRSALASAWRLGKSEPTEQARVNLSQVEARLGLKVSPARRVQSAEIQRGLGPQEALISFFTGESQSWMWALTRTTFDVFPLPDRTRIVPLAKQYRAGIQAGNPSSGASTDLYTMLFGPLGPSVQSKQDWLLSLDEGLHGVPFASLGPPKAPLILFHSLRSISGAVGVSGSALPVESGEFVGAGDAIYNAADSRWKGPRPANTMGFARLVNTAHEVQNAARAWAADSQPTILLGGKFNRDALDEALRSHPGVLHIAAHVVQHPTDVKAVMIGIGLGQDGMPDFLTPSDIAAKSLRVGLVSVNGCASGAGAELPGAGLVGLTRSWLTAGATAVAATYWAVPDEPGDLFVRMYTDIAARQNGGITAAKAARALQSAQVGAWQAGGDTGKWAAVFLSSNN